MTNREELDLKRLQAALRLSPIGHTIDYHHTIGSTMPPAHKLGESPTVQSGHILVAEEQTAGKGRRGRTWVTPYAQALLMSVVLKPPMLPADPAQVPMAAGLAVADALQITVPELGDAVSLKWPNDVLLGQSLQSGKVAGILTESAYDETEPAYIVIGIGINANQVDEDLPEVAERMAHPVSIRSYLGNPIDRTDLLLELCGQLAIYLDPRRSPDALLERWRTRLSTLGQRVAVYLQPVADEPVLIGLALDVSPSGNLLVEDADGQIHSFSAADVSVRDAAN